MTSPLAIRPVLALLAALVLALAPAALATPRANLADIEDEVMCPICGTALHLSQSPQAERQRAFIRRLVDDGRSKEEIKAALVDEYGPEVLALPAASGFDLAAWLVPGAGVLLAAVALIAGARRWRRAARAGSASSPPLPEADAARLDADLARYD